MQPAARTSLRVVAALYLLGIWQEGIGCSVPSRVLPKSLDYFLQIAALFPDAATSASQFRVQAYICTEQRWTELQTRPYFPLDPDDKENRFQRAIHFYSNEKPVMRALDQYLVDRHNAGTNDDGIPRDERIGGINLLTIKVPIPRPGAQLERYRWRPLSDYPDKQRYKGPYRTLPKKIDERCGVVHETPVPAPGPASASGSASMPGSETVPAPDYQSEPDSGAAPMSPEQN